MQDAGLEGVVKLDVLIGTDGHVASVRVLSSQVHPDFAASAAAAVRQWEFTPTLLNGRAGGSGDDRVDLVQPVRLTKQMGR